MNRIVWTLRAVRQLRRLAREQQERIRDAVGGLASFPATPNVKRLVHHGYGFRLRVGDHRVLFDFDGVIRVITIEEVRKRDESTY
jgi:mRNA-degrading endonuclease RelE of RelBE toxin-antitoxin system